MWARSCRFAVTALCLTLAAWACNPGRVYHGLKVETSPEDEPLLVEGAPEGEKPPLGVPVDNNARVSPEAPGCARGQVLPAAAVPVHMMLVIDRSWSMNDTEQAKAQQRDTKWIALRNAVQQLLAQMGKEAADGDQTLALGINYFSEARSGDDGTASDTSPESTVEFEPAALTPARARALSEDIARSSRAPGGRTPSETALDLGYQSLAAYRPGGSLADGRKVLVFISDGKPSPQVRNESAFFNAIAAHARDGIETYSLGIGEVSGKQDDTFGYDPLFMHRIAVSGGSAASGCDTSSPNPAIARMCHYQITPSASSNVSQTLVDALTAVRDRVRSCSLALAIEDAARLEKRAVIVIAEDNDKAQRALGNDAQNGWTYSDEGKNPAAIALHGASCNALKQKQTSRVFAILGCRCEQAQTRDIEGGAAAGEWETNWCATTYPWNKPDCVGEGCGG